MSSILKELCFGIAFLASLHVFAPHAFADEANYFYDDIGRLVRVAKGTEGLTYQYDQVGNLLLITKGTISTGLPTLQSINPDLLFIGSETAVTITGSNLFTTKAVTSDSQFLTIKNLSVSDTTIKAEITVSPDASPGIVVTITVTTLYGSANIQATLTASKLTFSPSQLALAPGDNGTITATLVPGVGRNLTITINNSEPSVVSAPQLITIPTSGETAFSVTAIKEGITTIRSGSTNAVIFVGQPFAPEPGEAVTMKAGPVSVYVETPASLNATTPSLPVSVYVETSSGNATTPSLPVSAYIEAPSLSDITAPSLPVSVSIEAASEVNATTSSLPVSAYIEAPSGDSTVVSLPVSTAISP